MIVRYFFVFIHHMIEFVFLQFLLIAEKSLVNHFKPPSEVENSHLHFELAKSLYHQVHVSKHSLVALSEHFISPIAIFGIESNF